MSRPSEIEKNGRDERPWAAHAACRGHDTSIFYPLSGEPDPRARALCNVCTVQPDCLDYATTNHEDHGIWGGASERERRRIRRHQQRRSA